MATSPHLHSAGWLETDVGNHVKGSVHSLLLFEPCLHSGIKGSHYSSVTTNESAVIEPATLT